MSPIIPNAVGPLHTYPFEGDPPQRRRDCGVTKRVNHTPGPWTYQRHHTQLGTFFTVRDLRNIHILTVEEFDAAVTPELEANAALMTAGPELYQLARKVEYALSRCLNADGSWCDMPASYKRELLELARAANKKVAEAVP